MATATLNWTLPTTRTDGTALAATEIASVNIMDSDSGVPGPIAVAPGAVTTFTTPSLAGGPHHFSVSVNDTGGVVSGPSNAVLVTVAAPSPPTNLTVILNP